MGKKRTTVIPDLNTLLGLLDQRQAWRRERWSIGGHNRVAAREANRLARRRAHWKRRPGVTYDGTDRSRKLALAGWKVLTARMVPGEWYAVTDMAELAPEYAYKTVKCWAVKLRRLEITERTRNPDFDDGAAPGRQLEPQWLHRLTARGEEAGREWREALAEIVAPLSHTASHGGV